MRWREGARRYGRTFDRRGDAVAFDVAIRRRQQLGGFVTLDLDVPLEQFCDEWWALHVLPNLSPHTQHSYGILRDRYLLPSLGRHRLREITPRVVSRLSADLVAAGGGAPTVRKALAVLQSMLAMAVREERLESNPVAKVRKPPQMPSRLVDPLPPVTVEAMRRLLGVEDATLLSLLAYAGLRPGEALGLRWSRVGQRSLAIERSVVDGAERPTKTGRSRSVRLLGPLADDLEDWRSICSPPTPHAFLFSRPDGSPWRDDDWRNWRRRIYQPAARAVGLPDSRPYDLRSSFVSLLIFEGQTVVEVARQAGHAPETCLRHYARVFADYDPARRVSAEEQIRQARLGLGRPTDAPNASGRELDAA